VSRVIRSVVFLLFALPTIGVAQQKKKAPAKKPSTGAMADMRGMDMGGMNMPGMPIPMPKGMPMIPGLVGLVPPVASFLPGKGLDPCPP
jgi:hypothetical protein